MKPTTPVTKEQMIEERRILKEYNQRPSKKVMEAKFRKKRKEAKQMNRIKKKAMVIAEEEGVTEGSKVREIGKLYRKEHRKVKDKKEIIVGKGFKSTGKRSGRKYKMVDKRMKQDLRSEKNASKRKEKSGRKGKSAKISTTFSKGGKGGKRKTGKS
jgi:AdoMet-dependent rRNA methyltransferase SPB1